ncbi:proton-conducting transporter membrane subunit [Halobacteriales archaeon Cl-PHB]
MIDHLPVLVVVVPLIAAPVALGLGLVSDRTGWHVAALASLLHVAVAGLLFRRVLAEGRLSYAAGNFPLPQGIELAVDAISATVVLLVAVVAAAVVAYARTAGPRTNGFFTLYLLLVGGLSGMTVTGDAFNLYVFLEIAGLTAYGLVASGDSEESAVAAFRYLLIGTVGASLYLLGVGYLLIATGTLNMADLAGQIGTEAMPYTSPLVVAAFGLIVGGLSVKVALFPLHTWQPDAYSTAPDSVATLISALVSTVAAYAVGRLILSVFTPDFFVAVPVAQTAILAGAGASILAGSALAVLQSDIRRMLAYSSVSQFGMVVAGFVVATPLAVFGALVHLVGHAIMKGGLFATAGVVERATGAREIDDFAGLVDRSPVGAAAVAVLGLAMVGVPPAVGFVGKWYIVVGAVEAGRWAVAALVVTSTVLTLAYFARLVERMFVADAGPDAESASAESPSSAEPAAMTDGRGSAAVSPGMVAVVVAAALAAVLLGPAMSALQPFVTDALTVIA